MTDNRDPAPPPGVSVRQFTDELLHAATAGAYEEVAEALDVLARADSAQVAASVVGELVVRCTATLRDHERADAGTVFTVVIEDQGGEPAEVERLPPGPRSALRALLAALNHDAASRDIHVDLATRGSPADVVAVLTHLLVWIAELSDPSGAPLPVLSCFTE
ncbi:hypothetical protein [Amycolatopsis solani]|uniref:hypothetical protein n=1 Tax=Amycolatopsis solani TaxID=3028615 RepID=UPI0025B15AB2|nr:hypothetical protein [Amycolatopsis sp. MEP2-6]